MMMMMMMMMGDAPARQAPPWTLFDGGDSPDAALEALLRYLPSNETDSPSPALDAYSSDEFRIYEFKVRRCARGRSHDWTDCPFAHPGEKARRRDPRRHHYSGAACPDFRKGGCRRGDACEFAHGVFECWLHPARYRTQPCKDGLACRRRVCFFAHTPDQLRVVGAHDSSSSSPPASYDGSPMRRHSLDAYLTKGLLSSSPTSTLVSPPESPPVSPSAMDEVLASMRRLKMGSLHTSWGGAIGSPRAVEAGCYSLPSTPTRVAAESGRALRSRMFERLSSESGMDESAPDVAWVSELVQ